MDIQKENIDCGAGNDFWGRVLELIRIFGISQQSFAGSCGITYGILKGWISKGTLPFAEMTCYMAEFLGVSVDYLTKGH